MAHWHIYLRLPKKHDDLHRCQWKLQVLEWQCVGLSWEASLLSCQTLDLHFHQSGLNTRKRADLLLQHTFELSRHAPIKMIIINICYYLVGDLTAVLQVRLVPNQGNNNVWRSIPEQLGDPLFGPLKRILEMIIKL